MPWSATQYGAGLMKVLSEAAFKALVNLEIGVDVAAQVHTHAASDIASGTLLHERGGLEADVSAFSGLVKITGGATSAVTVTSAAESLLDDSTVAAMRTTLGLNKSLKNLYPTGSITALGSAAGGGETDLMSYTLAGGTVDENGEQIIIECVFTFAANGNNKTVKIYVADQVVFNSGAAAENGGALRVRVIVSRGTATAIAWTSLPTYKAGSAFTAAPVVYSSGTIVTPSGGLASNCVIKATGTGTSLNDVVQREMLIDFRPITL